MTGIEPGSSGIVSDRSANCATTTKTILFCNMLIRKLTWLFAEKGNYQVK